MSGKKIVSAAKYTDLAVRKGVPRVIRTDAEYDHALAVVDNLMGGKKTAEESALLDTWVTLIEDYEEAKYQLPEASPADVIRFLMDQQDLTQTDLVPGIFSSRGHASDVIRGRREVSRQLAVKLAAYFQVSAELFLKKPALKPISA